MLQNFFNNKLFESKTILCEIMTNHGSDKGLFGGAHNYTTLYHYLFEPLRSSNIILFECGLGTNNPGPSSMNGQGNPGGSLRGWREYFSNGLIFGADVDSTTLFEDYRIKTFFCDQTDSNAVNQMLECEDLKSVCFDIIIDDGLHIMDVNASFCEIMIHKLKRGGIYIIEDIDSFSDSSAVAFVNKHKSSFEFIDYVKIPLTENGGNNNVVIIKK